MKAHDEQVTISLNEEILCPHGEGHRFTLREGLAESTIRQTAQSEESQKAKIREQAFQEQMAAQARLIDEIRRQLSEKSAAEFDLQQSIEALKAEQNLALAKAAADA